MDVDAVVSGILIMFLGVLLLLQRLGVITSSAMYVLLPYILLVVGALVVYVGVVKGRLSR